MQIFLRYILPVMAAVFLGIAVYHVQHTATLENVPASTPLRHPPISPFPECVSGSGIVESQGQNINVGTQAAGIVTKVVVQVGQVIEAQATLFELDSRIARANLEQAIAALASAEAQLQRLNAAPRLEEIPLKEAVVAEAKATLTEKQKELVRANLLMEKQAATAEDRDVAATAVATSTAQLQLAEADLQLLRSGAWKADRQVMDATVKVARSQVLQAQTAIDLLTVKSAVAGEVLQVNIRPGEFASSPSEVPLIVLGATTQLHVRVDIDEHDISRFEPAAETVGLLRGHPEARFRMKFKRIEPFVIPKKTLSGENTERIDTRVLQVIYEVEDPPKNLFVGQQLDVFSKVAATSGVKPD